MIESVADSEDKTPKTSSPKTIDSVSQPNLRWIPQLNDHTKHIDDYYDPYTP